MQRHNPSVVAITGASAGVGRATVELLAGRGCRLALLARDRGGLSDTAATVEALGGRALALPVDVADAAAVEQAAAAAEDELGPIDTWINCAMVTVFSPVSEMAPEEFRRVMEVTYLGYVHGTLAALKRMKPRDAGVIVQVGSALAYRAIPLQSAYCAAKFAVRGFTDALRSELLHDRSRVRLSMVQLPAVNTPQFEWARNRLGRQPRPVPPIFAPEVAARAVLRAAEEAPRELWLGGSAIKAIVGGALAPGLADRLLATQGYDGQMTEEPAADRPGNLQAPVAGLHRRQGRFAARARKHALALKPETLRAAVTLAAAGLAAGALVGGVRRMLR